MITTVNYHSSAHLFRVKTAAPLQHLDLSEIANDYLGPDFAAVELPYSPSYFVWSVEEASA